MKISMNGFGENMATFACGGTTVYGSLVKMSDNGTVSPCVSGDVFCGVANSTRNGFAAVQLNGYREIPYTGTAPKVGYQTLAASGAQSVSTVSTGGRSYLVVDVDPNAKTIGMML